MEYLFKCRKNHSKNRVELGPCENNNTRPAKFSHPGPSNFSEGKRINLHPEISRWLVFIILPKMELALIKYYKKKEKEKENTKTDRENLGGQRV